jgi:hypothetical protein
LFAETPDFTSASSARSLKKVRLYDETIEHIKEEHQEVPIELPSMIHAIGTTITQPTHVESSYGGSFVFVDSRTTNASGDPFRVPVKPIAGTTSARIRTAYFATADVPEEQIVWRRSDE